MAPTNSSPTARKPHRSKPSAVLEPPPRCGPSPDTTAWAAVMRSHRCARPAVRTPPPSGPDGRRHRRHRTAENRVRGHSRRPRPIRRAAVDRVGRRPLGARWVVAPSRSTCLEVEEVGRGRGSDRHRHGNARSTNCLRPSSRSSRARTPPAVEPPCRTHAAADWPGEAPTRAGRSSPRGGPPGSTWPSPRRRRSQWCRPTDRARPGRSGSRT